MLKGCNAFLQSLHFLLQVCDCDLIGQSLLILVKLVLLFQLLYLTSQLVDIVVLPCDRFLSLLFYLESECLQVLELLDRYEVILIHECWLVLLLVLLLML